MRLASFKAHGFKSFADSVSFKVGGELIGVVGPNGCGKSNIVDAVRWVLGESRASSLRGATLSDVMFNGTEKRNPADWCYVELRFSNETPSENTANNMWAAYPEIIVRRELDREGKQSYTINGNTARRRDVVDLFRGTGVAPRAYGVVEQGMVTDVAEASPDELRSFMEEAAGVSHYKERRRDSERRLQASRENLGQLALILDGLQKRAESLKRQARTAQRHRELGETINGLDALLILSRQQESREQLAASRQQLQEWEKQKQALQENLSQLKTQSEEKKESRQQMQIQIERATTTFNEAQKALTSAEHNAQNAVEGKSAARHRLQEAQNEFNELTQQSKQQVEEEQQLQLAHEQTRSEKEKNSGFAEAESTELTRLHINLEQAQEAVNRAREQLTAAQRNLESETVRQQMLNERIVDIRKRLAAVMSAIEQLPAATAMSEEALAEQQLEKLQQQLTAEKEQYEQQRLQNDAADTNVRQLENDVAMLTAEINTLNAMLQEDSWQESQQRLAHVLQVDAGVWARALDAALGTYAAAAAVDDIDEFLQQQEFPPAGAALVETAPPAGESGENRCGLPTLLSVLQAPEEGQRVLAYWLAGVYAAEDGASAQAARHHLTAGQTIVTRDGVVYGAHSLLVTGETRGGYDWERRMRELLQVQASKEAALTEQRTRYVEATEATAAMLQTVERLQSELAQEQQAASERRIEFNRRIEQQRALNARHHDLEQQQQTLQQQEQAVSAENAAFATNISRFEIEQKSCNEVFGREQHAFENASHSLESYRAVISAANIKRRDVERQGEEIKRRQDDLQIRKRENSERQQMIERRVRELNNEVEKYDESALQKKLASCREQIALYEQHLQKSREQLRLVENESAQIEEQREQNRNQVDQQQQRVTDERLREHEFVLRMETFNDSLEELALSEQQLADCKAQLPGDVDAWQTQMDELRGKRDRLGAINFMAESELHECEAKLGELEGQKNDIEAAIEELRTAILRIDNETKTRLQSTFEAVNREFALLYKRMFDGGEARLEMVGEAILESGFEIKVRPPGKRMFPVRMLSGGEKAASAVAFIFSILRLNPPPFCILDEVDAPLDDNRSRRFVDLLQDISATVQCIVVSHNKSTISAMPRLIGVTQEEPGASKVVAVTLGDALRAVSE